MDKFEMKIVKKDGIVQFETKFGDGWISNLKVNSYNKKEIKRYLKKFLINKKELRKTGVGVIGSI